ncbi:sigma-70 family RNA polymerase sigma factor [Nocardia sp. NPDC050175]|uniref:sigma-70 family RNA polymerase sigma factor n=1 Tax=Nocardia sp. NPDC050175 TaxID=3364317 RepID=UPI0037AE2A43
MDLAESDDAEDRRIESAAYKAFFESHREYIVTYVRNRRAAYNADVDAVVDVGDVVQETMLAALLDWAKVRSIEQPRSWLRSVAKNKLVDQIRRASTRKDYAMPLEELTADEDPGPPGGLDRVLAQEAMVEVFGLLSPPQRDVLTKTMSGLTVREIAKQMGLSVESVYKHRTKARRVIVELQQRRAQPATNVKPANSSPTPMLSLRTSRAVAATSGLTDDQLAQRYPDLARTLGVHHPADNDLARVIELYEKSLARREETFGDDHPATMSVRTDLGRALRAAGQYKRAVPLLEHALRDQERRLGDEHRDNIAVRSDLADSLRATGQFCRARELYEQVLTAQQRLLGTYHPRTLTTHARLARTCLAAGDLAQAIEHFERALTHRERVLGPEHRQTMAARADLAEALRRDEQYRRAIPVLSQVLTEQIRNLGADHPRTLTTHARLACTYRDAGDLPHAIEHFEQVLNDCERVLGSIHSDTNSARAGFASALHIDKQYERAIPLLKIVLLENEQFLGPEHRQSRSTRAQLATACEATGRLEQALQLYRINLRLQQQWIGSYQPETMECRKAVVRVLYKNGERAPACHEQEWVIADLTHHFGRSHPATQDARLLLSRMIMTRNSHLQEPYNLAHLFGKNNNPATQDARRPYVFPTGNCAECAGTPCCGGPPDHE